MTDRAFLATRAGRALRELHDVVGHDVMHRPDTIQALGLLIAEIQRLQHVELMWLAMHRSQAPPP